MVDIAGKERDGGQDMMPVVEIGIDLSKRVEALENVVTAYARTDRNFRLDDAVLKALCEMHATGLEWATERETRAYLADASKGGITEPKTGEEVGNGPLPVVRAATRLHFCDACREPSILGRVRVWKQGDGLDRVIREGCAELTRDGVRDVDAIDTQTGLGAQSAFDAETPPWCANDAREEWKQRIEVFTSDRHNVQELTVQCLDQQRRVQNIEGSATLTLNIDVFLHARDRQKEIDRDWLPDGHADRCVRDRVDPPPVMP